jgi:menaquinone-dependent protoporphyrinogen oxidase
MKVLVTVASKHGSTYEIAQAIAEELRSTGIDADLCKVTDARWIAGYDAVVLGSGIYAGSWLTDAQDFAEQYRAQLAKVPVWLFSSGPLGEPDPKPYDDPQKLAAPIGAVPVRDHKIFVGKLDPEELGLGERLIVRMVKAPAGDFRNWEDIRGWAHEIAAELNRSIRVGGAIGVE